MRTYLILILSLLLTACSPVNSVQPFDREQAKILIRENITTKPAHQMVALNLPRMQPWELIAGKHTSETAMMLPAGQTLSNWHECIQTDIRGYNLQPNITAEKFMQSEIDAAHADCTEVRADTLAKSKQFILYKTTMNQCKNGKNQTQITKILNGIDGVYLVRYVALSEISAEQFALMAQVIKHAQLVQNARYH